MRPKLFPFSFALISLVAASANAAIVTVLPLGDSITDGYDGVPMAGYRLDLLNELASQNVNIQYQGVYDPTTLQPYGQNALGYSPALTALGQNFVDAFPQYGSADILGNLAASNPPSLPNNWPFIGNQGGYWLTGGNGTGRAAQNPNIVLLMVGTNDGLEHVATTDLENNIAGILDWFAANRPGTKVLVASPPAAGSLQSYGGQINTEVQIENTWLGQNIGNFSNATYVDVYDAFLNSDGSVNTSLLTSVDQIHPSDAGYQVIANLYDAAIVSAISPVPEPTSGLLALTAFAVASARPLGRRRHRPAIDAAAVKPAS